MNNDYAVHAEHCCKYHGCKYGDKNCPVVKEKVKQLWPCEDCYEEMDEAEYYTSVVSRLPQMYELRLEAQKRAFNKATKENTNEQQ